MLTLPTYPAWKVRNVIRGLLQAYGTRKVKRYLWNFEFSRGRWTGPDDTPDDCVYPYIEQHANKGSILDLGCGRGNTGNELASIAYRDYTGVDISDVAIASARRKTQACGRGDKNHYLQSDICAYVPTQQFEVILFRDSIFYVPHGKVKAMLRRYSKYLKEGGVFIVRMWDWEGGCANILDTMESNFEVVEKHFYYEPKKAVVIVFRPPM